MSAESSLLSRARSFTAALALAVVGAPLATALAPAPAHAAAYGSQVVDRASKEYGKPYSYGSTGPSSFDCSGFSSYVYRQFGVSLPRTSGEQYNAVPHVSQAAKEVGDLIFTYDSGGIYHVGIYAGGDQMWAATHTGDVVRLQTIWTPQYLVGRPAVGGAIGAKWQSLGGSRSVLGQAVHMEYGVPGGAKTDYQAGDIYWSARSGAHEVHGAIGALYDRSMGSGGFLGMPLTDEYAVRGGRANRFANGAAYWSPGTDVHEVHGGIGAKYDAVGGPDSPLGLPTADEAGPADARVSTFQAGAIYWSSSTGSVEVHGAILDRYRGLGGPGGSLGLPVADERDAPGGGRESAFQHGVLRWDPATGQVERVR